MSIQLSWFLGGKPSARWRSSSATPKFDSIECARRRAMRGVAGRWRRPLSAYGKSAGPDRGRSVGVPGTRTASFESP
jgi:hypothetical protein